MYLYPTGCETNLRLLPKSAFGQTAVLIALLLLINQVVTYLSVTFYFIQPSYQQISSLVATQMNSIMLQQVYRSDHPQYEAFQRNTGIQFHSERTAMHAGLRDAKRYQWMSQQVSQAMQGEAVDIRISTNTDLKVWLRPASHPELWVAIPLKGIADADVSPLMMYLLVISVLSVAGGWLFVSRMNKPLRALQHAAQQVGSGQFPSSLPLEGSTEMISVTQAFNQMSQGIQRLESDRVLMTAGISHDLRTPLTRIRLASEMLPPEQDWVKDGIEHDIDDMNNIIDQFIEYARQDREKISEHIDLNALVQEMVNARSIQNDYQIDLQLAELPQIKGRELGLKRVLDNLIENAFRYGSNHVTISTEYDSSQQHAVCTVRDFGKGIDEEQIPHLLSPFTQGDRARGSVGSGLGLAITKRIIESHGGTMRFSNHPYGGLKAGFSLPAA